MILKMLDSAHQKTLWLCILPKKLRSEKEYNVIISLSMQRNRKQLFHAASIDHLNERSQHASNTGKSLRFGDKRGGCLPATRLPSA